MTAPNKSWQSNVLQNTASLRPNQNVLNAATIGRTPPYLPPRPDGMNRSLRNNTLYSGYGGYGGYNNYGGLSSYGSYGGLSSYGSYGMPYGNSMFNSYGGGYNNFGMYNYSNDDTERRFIQYAEESSRQTFANVESIVRAFSSIAMMLDNTFFAMTSSFRAVLSVAENFGRLRSTFGQIWYSLSLFRIFNWLYRRVMNLFGFKGKSSSSIAWKQAIQGAPIDKPENYGGSGSSWPTLAFLGVLVSAPYIISKFLPKYEDKSNMSNWKSPGIPAKAAFNFTASDTSEMSLRTNDEIVLAPTYIQETMNLKNSGWVFAVCNGNSGIVPLNHLVLKKINKKQNLSNEIPKMAENVFEEISNPVLKNNENKSDVKTHSKRVSFGENQIFENIDLDDVIKKAEDEARQYKNNSNSESSEDVKKNDSK